MTRSLLAMVTTALALTVSPTQAADDGFAAIIPEGAQRVEEVQAELEVAFEDGETLRFQCRNGEFGGGDFDSALELKADGTATLIDYGFALIEHAGTYEIAAGDDGSAELVVTFNDRPGWPALALYAAGEDLLLIPAAGTPDDTYEHNGTPVAEYAVTVWPYRLVATNGAGE